MKRFFCTVCNRIKRVRKYPVNITTPNAYDVLDRKGVCNFHLDSQRNSQSASQAVLTARMK